MKKIFTSVESLKSWCDSHKENIVMTSGGFDPMHVGHLRCLQESAVIAASLPSGRLAVVVNGDGFLLRKKGYAFMPEAERAEIIAGVSGVDYVVLWDDGSQFVSGAVEILKPVFFTKGGDRTSSENVPEFQICEKIGCKVLFGIGGGKIQSSSVLVESVSKQSGN
jgi:D-beta-D-heptose 7-phosphate kinase/D-beta-D-heptose 1-phosphate adenosyltransferase